MQKTFTCTLCGQEYPQESCTDFKNHQLCPDCLEEHTRICDHCGERIWLEDIYGDDHVTLCQNCYESYYSSCCECGRLVEIDELHYMSEDSFDGYCENCYRLNLPSYGVQCYYFKPDPIFYGQGTRFLGVELEIDGAGESDDNANSIQTIGNRNHTHIYIKHDGSLDDGLEIVTHPMTLEYHRQEMPWKAVIDKALYLGYTSHKIGTCGLHVHVNRSSLGITYEEQENTIARILFLVETFWNEFLRFSRRTQSQMDQWASRYGRRDNPKDVLHSAKRSGDRYTCVNLTPEYTIEFRLFRGTLKYNTLIATLQMVDRICDVARYFSDHDIKALTWSEFVLGLRETTTPELLQYLKERRLYVNEPVDASEEV